MSFMDKLMGRKPGRGAQSEDVAVATAPVPAAKPEWMQRTDVKLPPWASIAENSREKFINDIVIDGPAAYAEWLATLMSETPKHRAAWDAALPKERTKEPPEVLRSASDVDQYWLEVAYQCIKLDIDMALAGTALDPAGTGKHGHRKITRAAQYAQADYADNHAVVRDGKPMSGAERATQGREAREHYKRIRGNLPR
jgi:hypothetical protein